MSVEPFPCARRQPIADPGDIRWIENMISAETREKVLPRLTEVPSIVFDYCYVALRKRVDTPFVRPVQEIPAERNWYPENFA